MLADHPLTRWDAEQSYFAQESAVRQSVVVFHFCPSRRRDDTISHAGDVDARGTHFAGGLGDYAAVAGDGSPAPDWAGPDANGALTMAVVVEKHEGRLTQWKSRTRLESLRRGASNTLLLGEKHVPPGGHGDAAFGDGTLYSGQHSASFARAAGPGFPLAASLEAPFQYNFGGIHSRVCNFLMADGSTRPTTYDIQETILAELARRGE